MGAIADLESLLSSVLPLSTVRSGAETLELVAYLIFAGLYRTSNKKNAKTVQDPFGRKFRNRAACKLHHDAGKGQK